MVVYEGSKKKCVPKLSGIIEKCEYFRTNLEDKAIEFIHILPLDLEI